MDANVRFTSGLSTAYTNSSMAANLDTEWVLHRFWILKEKS